MQARAVVAAPSGATFLERVTLDRGPLNRECLRHESAVTREDFSAFENLRLPAIALAVKPKLAGEVLVIGGADEGSGIFVSVVVAAAIDCKCFRKGSGRGRQTAGRGRCVDTLGGARIDRASFHILPASHVCPNRTQKSEISESKR